MTLFTVNRATNAEMTKRILAFYCPPPANILDATYGYGGFWKDFQGHTFTGDYELTTMDIRTLPGVQEVRDYTKPLPFADSSFGAIFFDPPYSIGEADHSLVNYSNSPFHYNHGISESALQTDPDCLFGSGEMTEDTSREFARILTKDGIVAWKHLRRPAIPTALSYFDFLIQDLGKQPVRFTNGRARVNHALWLILKKVLA